MTYRSKENIPVRNLVAIQPRQGEVADIRSFLQNPQCLADDLNAFREKLKQVLGSNQYDIGLSAIKANSLPQPWLHHTLFQDLSLMIRHWKICVNSKTRHLVRQGLPHGQQIFLFPLFNGLDPIGILEIGTPTNIQDDHFLRKPEAIEQDISRAVQLHGLIFENKLLSTFTNVFSAFHPCVKWKFEECVLKSMLRTPRMDCHPIEFKQVQALFAQADIIHSTKMRNQAFHQDLVQQCLQAEEILSISLENTPFPTFDGSLSDLRALKSSLRQPFDTKTELEAYYLFKDRINPLIKEIGTDDIILNKSVHQYFRALDSEDHIFNQARGAYEESIALINNSISRVLDEKARKAQLIIAHYFQKHTTDGVAFQIYAGQSLLKGKVFRQLHLDNLRLWQLETLCEIARMVHYIKDSIPVPLDTAQLVVAYGRPINLSYRLDEKCLDVEHGRHVRYEMLKKRLDKSTIKSTGERLRKSGTISIAYTHDYEIQSYLKHIRTFQKQSLLSNEIEELELETFQGVKGMKAIRTKVLY